MEIRTIEQVAQRLAGGFLRPVDGDTLARAADEALRAMPAADLGDLQAIADLPGLPGALAATLNKAWLADIDLAKEAAGQPGVVRLATIAKLERAVLDRLPNGMLRPGDLARRATLERLPHAPAVLGPIELDYLIDVAPCWRVLLMLLHRPREVFWRSGAHVAPAWWIPPCKDETLEEVTTPALRAVTCATARHEVIEAMRWARGLLATGTVQAGQIAFAAASPGEYDDLILALGAEASLDIHFAHGRRALTTRDGQAAAALADVLLHGLSQDRVRRLARLAHADGTPFGRMPDDWLRHLPRAAPLSSPVRWRQIADMPADLAAILLPAIDLIAEGTAKAAEAGETFLRGTARAAVAPRPAARPGYGARGQPGCTPPARHERGGDVHRLDARGHPGLLPPPLRLAARPERPYLAAQRRRGSAAAQPYHPRQPAGPAAADPGRPAGVPRDPGHHGVGTGVLRQPPRRHRSPARPVAADAGRPGAGTPAPRPESLNTR